MVEQNKMNRIINDLSARLTEVFPDDDLEPILFGSYARGDAEEGSDIDVLMLVNASREDISRKNRQVGDVAGDLLLMHGVLVSPIVENRDYFNRNAEVLPLYRTIQREGVRVHA